MYCKKCGVELRAGAKFCQKCGAEVPKAKTMSTELPSTGAHSSAPAYSMEKEPALVKTIPESSENRSNGQFHEWFSQAGDL